MHAGRSRIWTALGALLVAVSIGACASSGEGGLGQAALVVENNLMGTATVTVYAVPEVGSRRLIGTVGVGTETLRFTPAGAGSTYQFVAEDTGRGDLVSNPVTVSPGATLRWDLGANIINVVESG